MFRNVNLYDKLKRERGLSESEAANVSVSEVFHWLNDAYCNERRILANLDSAGAPNAEFSMATLEPEKVFSIKEIERLCIKYRLRFLDSQHYKGEYPYEAVLEIKRMEEILGVELTKFKMVAPSAMFELADCDKDPLLFLPLSEKYFYLVASWGNDLAWYRKALMFPLRSLKALAASIAVLSFLIAILIPTEWMMSGVEGNVFYARLAFFFWCLICITSILTYVGFAFFKNVSSAQWNSPYFKQNF
jgi:hypothetical protein